MPSLKLEKETESPGVRQVFSPERLEVTHEEDSPFIEVRAAVPNTDQPNMPQCTIRAWVIGFVVISFMSVVNMLLSLHEPSIILSDIVSLLIVWPIGRLWDHVVPNFRVLGQELNPCPFTMKEHALINVMISSAVGESVTYSTELMLVFKKFYKSLKYDWVRGGILAIAAPIFGISIAGLLRRILTYPAEMVFPSTLVNVTIMSNIHLRLNHVANGWVMTRLRFFLIILSVGILYQWIPSFFAPFLSSFDFPALIAPKNVVLNQLFGIHSGLGLFPLTFDWNQITSYLGSPLVPPLGTFVNGAVCIVIFYWIVVPVIHFSNVWFGNYLPMISNGLYDRYQQEYDVNNVLSQDQFDEYKYHKYSQIFMPEGSAIAYGLALASFTATIVHTLLYESKNVVRLFRQSSSYPMDIHMQMMQKYPEVHIAWFLGLLLISLIVIIIVSIVHAEAYLDVRYVFLALLLSVIMAIPITLVYAVMNVTIGINVISEYIAGYLVKGKPLSFMMFKTFCYYTNLTTIRSSENMKIGHYCKLRPSYVLVAQVLATIWGAIVQICVTQWAVNNIDDLCDPEQALGYTCPRARTFYNSSILWGLIGPQRLFVMYKPLVYFFVIGAGTPLLFYLWTRRRQRSFLRRLHWPVIFNTAIMMPPAVPYNYVLWITVGFFSTLWVKRYWFSWWSKYNYTLSASLDLGVAFGQILIFTVCTPHNLQAPKWWGSDGFTKNADAELAPLVKLAPGEFFGPASW